MKILLFTGLIISQLAAQTTPDLKEGNMFPNFELENVATKKVAPISHHFGKKTLLHIFASW